MGIELKPIRNLVMVSIILHLVGLFVSTVMLVFLQRPLWSLFTGQVFPEEATLFFPPAIVVVPIIAVFILHCGLTMGFLRMVNHADSNLKQFSIFSILVLVAVSIVFPIISFAWSYLQQSLIAHSVPTGDEFLAFIATQQLMAFGFVIRSISISILLIAASMSWYYCFTKKTENRETST
ncbi:MAG: hypothetical protein FWD97_09135 [Defluviitaleaceae bacterium]|nr:hypothetical protein [Defluviitaleaceae bacterium]